MRSVTRRYPRAGRRSRDDLRRGGLRAGGSDLDRVSGFAPRARGTGRGTRGADRRAHGGGAAMRDAFQEFEISPEIVNEMMESGEEVVMVDVREDWEWE